MRVPGSSTSLDSSSSGMAVGMISSVDVISTNPGRR
jgi:hypothetical protein